MASIDFESNWSGAVYQNWLFNARCFGLVNRGQEGTIRRMDAIAPQVTAGTARETSERAGYLAGSSRRLLAMGGGAGAALPARAVAIHGVRGAGDGAAD